MFKGRGISSYVDKPEKAGEMVKDCIENIVLKTIPHKDIKKTPIYLGATAGMRLLWYDSVFFLFQVFLWIMRHFFAFGVPFS